MSLLIVAVTHPRHLQWYQWGQILGIALPFLWITLGISHPLLWAIGVHLLLDFVVQSDETATGKIQGNWRVLSYHAFLSGGYAGLIVAGLPGLVASVIIHLLIDAANKFGYKGLTGLVLDQTAHLATLLALWWLSQ